MVNGDGVAGNPTITLSDSLTALTSIVVGDLTISENDIITTAANTPIQITPNGTGAILLGPGMTPPTVSSTGNITNVVTLTSTNIATDNLVVNTQSDLAQVRVTTNTITNNTNDQGININGNGIGNIVLQSGSTFPCTFFSSGFIGHLAIPKIWVVWTGNPVVVQNSYITGGVVRTATGKYTINFGFNTGTIYYIPLLSVETNGATSYVANYLNRTTTTVDVWVKDLTGTLADPTTISLVIIS